MTEQPQTNEVPRPLAAAAVRYTHLSLVVFTVVGFALPFRAGWVAHALLVPSTRLHWALNDGKCVMTTWERRLLGDRSEHRSGSFVRDLVEDWTGWMPSAALTTRAMAIWMWGGFAVSIFRLTR